MPRALASLILALLSWLLLALIMRGTLALYGAIVALMLGFAGAFLGFVAYDGEAPLGHRRLARAGAAVGCLAVIVGSVLFFRAVITP